MADPSSLLLGLVKQASKIVAKGLEFRSTRETLQSTTNELAPVVKQIEECIQRTDLPTDEIERLKGIMAAAQEVLRKYSKIRWWNFYLTPYYQSKLEAADKSLVRYISVELQMQMARNLEVIRSNLSPDDHHSLRRPQSIPAEETNYNRAPTTLEIPEFTVGLDGPLNKLKFELLNKDGGEHVLNLFGLPGSGKTTLAAKLCLDPQVKDKFKDNIIFETFGSQIQSNELLVNQLQDQLAKFGKNPVLLVLDDVQPVSKDLVEQLRVQIQISSHHSKILVISRLAIPEIGSHHPMEPLSTEDAENLFLHYVQPPKDIINSYNNGDEDIREILQKIVEGCTGLPLALKFIGGKLHRKRIEKWQEMVKEWSQGRSILDSDTELLTRLQNSLEVLEDESINERFMDLGLFPEDQNIPVYALIDMWIELYRLEEDGIYAMTLIYQLTDMNLADIIVRRKVASVADNYYNNHFIKQHVLLRDLAIRLSSQETSEKRKRLIIDINGNNIPKGWPLQQPQQEIAAHILSISTDQKITPEWCNIQAGEAEVLVLNLQTEEYTLPEFMNCMNNLKVLIVSSYAFHPTKLENLKLLVSLLSLKRIRLQHVSVPLLCKMEKVQKLSLYMCEVKKAFENSFIQISKALPELVELNIDYCKDMVKLPAGLCDITTLKKLSICNCHSFTELPQDIGKLENLELLRVSNCVSFKAMPKLIKELRSLSFLDVSDCVSLTELPDGIDNLKKLRKLYIIGSSISSLPYSFMNLENLKAIICSEETYASWENQHPKLKKMANDTSLDWLL